MWVFGRFRGLYLVKVLEDREDEEPEESESSESSEEEPRSLAWINSHEMS